MVRKGAKTKLFTAMGLLAALLLVVGVVAFLKPHPTSPASDTTQTKNTTPSLDSNKKDETKSSTSTSNNSSDTQPAIDPSTVSAVDITPMSLTVSYTKGIGGFDYAVQRTDGGAQYVQFSASKLVGTKCTDDDGTFASIIESPSSNESSIVTKTTTVDGTTYGLSLADSSCTSDAALLKQYQDAFSDAFTLLKKM